MIDMPRPRAIEPPPPREAMHHGRRCWLTRWRTYSPARHHAHRFYADSETQAMKEYRAWVKVWKADPRVRQPHRPDSLTIKQLAELYSTWAKATYRKRGRRSSHTHKISRAMDLLCELYAAKPADKLSAPDLAAWREWLVGEGISRATINAYLSCAKACYQWAAERGMVEATAAEGLRIVGWLKAGRTEAAESRKVESVSLEIVTATTAHLAPHLASMVWLQWLTGMRPDEVCSLRAIDIDRTGAVWFYRPPEHKLAHRGGKREVAIGPKARAIIEPLLHRLGYLFRPTESDKANGGAGQRYTSAAYRRAITRACDRAKVARWSPNMLRHAFATRAKKAFGIDASRAALGHATTDTTEIYLDRDRETAAKVARRMG